MWSQTTSSIKKQRKVDRKSRPQEKHLQILAGDEATACGETIAPPPAGEGGGPTGGDMSVIFASLPIAIRGNHGSELVGGGANSSIARKVPVSLALFPPPSLRYFVCGAWAYVSLYTLACTGQLLYWGSQPL